MIKEQVYRKCLDILNARIDKYKGELEIIKESIENNDQKPQAMKKEVELLILHLHRTK